MLDGIGVLLDVVMGVVIIDLLLAVHQLRTDLDRLRNTDTRRMP